MILIDYSQLSISNLHQQIKKGKGKPNDPSPEKVVDPHDLRIMILNSIRKVNKEFGRQYGQLVLCTDNSQYWRKSYFQYYKANRKKDRDDSGIDWKLVFNTLHTLRDEIKVTFPYKVMNVQMAEADDVIGVIAKHFHTKENILIISGDGDFIQLQVYPNVDQYSSVKDEFLKTSDPLRFLKEHIIRGDKGDGVPNFLSPDNVLVVKGMRQSSIMEAKLQVWLTQQPEEFCTTEQLLANYRRNETLVDLSKIPVAIETAILEEFDKPIEGRRDKIFDYLIHHRMSHLMESARDF
jgi:hypothetical protein